MRLGIDFGTTHTVVSVVDRGNYPVVSFRPENGETQEWFPSVVAEKEGEWRYGFEAMDSPAEEGWTQLKSFKRLLGGLHPDDAIGVGSSHQTALDLVTQYLQALKVALWNCANVTVAQDEPLEAFIAVPANANNKQRFLTLEAFQRAGFRVIGMINEPAAVGIEYSHQFGMAKSTGKQVIYDLGGGTFDVAIIGMGDRVHETLINEGLSRFGGDDFDTDLLNLALEKCHPPVSPDPEQRQELLRECQEKKQGIHANTRKIMIDINRAVPGCDPVIVETSEYYQRCEARIQETVDVVENAVASLRGKDADGWDGISSVYVVGGAAKLPVVSRVLKERYGRKVRKSLYSHAATAVGLAIASDVDAGYELQERFTRFFGVWREWDGGANIAFDPVFTKGTLLPNPDDGELVYRRNYRPEHNVGHFRYLECGYLNAEHEPDGDITPWQEVVFPFDPDLQGRDDLATIPVVRSKRAVQQVIEEVYRCNSNGLVRVTIKNKTNGYKQSFTLRP